MKHARPPLNNDTIEAFVASAVALAVRLLTMLLAGAHRRARRLDAFVARLERRVECIVFLKAVLRAPPPQRQRWRPGALVPGFRRTRGSLRHLLKVARIRARGASPIRRLARLIAVLTDSERYIARFLRRLVRGLRLSGIVPCAPPAVALAANPAHARAFADSS